MKKIALFIVAVILILSSLSVSVSAATSYDTYTYTYSGKMQKSPAAYSPETRISDFGDIGILKNPNDIVFDSSRDYIVIADTGNNRVVITDSKLSVVKTVSEFDNNGKKDSLSEPNGVFVNSKGNLYVADTRNGRILVFDKSFNLIKELPPLSADDTLWA